MIIFSKMEEEHLHHLYIVFKCFREHNLKLKPTKCEFLQEWDQLLGSSCLQGRCMTQQGEPKSCGWICSNHRPTLRSKPFWACGTLLMVYSGVCVHCATSAQASVRMPAWQDSWKTWLGLQDTYESLSWDPCAGFVDFNKPFLLETDTSKLGLGAVLSQKQTDGQYHLVAYMSCSLTVHKHNYHLIKQEFLALKWVITEQFQEYLLWKPFVVKTDNNPLTYIMTTPNLDATWHCWVESLTGFTFSIEYQKGLGQCSCRCPELSYIEAGCGNCEVHPGQSHPGINRKSWCSWPSGGVETDEEIHKQVQEAAIQARPVHIHMNLHMTDWVAAQWKIQYLRPWSIGSQLESTESEASLGRWHANTEEGMPILWEQKKLMLYQGALYHHHTLAGKLEEVLQFIVPMSSLSGCYEWMSPRCWTPGSAANAVPTAGPVLVAQHGHTDAESDQQLCKQCIQYEGTCAKAPMQPIIATTPLELLHVDFMSIEMTMELDQPPNVVNILVFCNHFMKHIMAYVTPDQTAKTIAKFLWQGYISIFRAPAKLLSNWGTNFESNIIKELCELMGIWKIRTSPYHAQTNGQVEWPHQMLMHMIGKLSKDQKAGWPKHLPELVHAYNSMRLSHHWYSPHYLMFGCWLHLPIDFYFPWIWGMEKHWGVDLLYCWVMWMTVRSLQGSARAVHCWGWETEVVLWQKG